MIKFLGILLATGGVIAYAESNLRKKRVLNSQFSKAPKSDESKSKDKLNKMNRKLDDELENSFPASDPPSFNSSI